MKPKLRFPEFADEWQVRQLHELLIVSNKKNTDVTYSKDEVLSVSGRAGIVNQIAFQGRSFAGVSVADYGVVEHGDVVYTKSPLKSNPFGIIRTNKGEGGIVSTLYAVYTPTDLTNSIALDYYFQLDDNTNKYLRPLVNKGAKNDMKISDNHALDGFIYWCSMKEQLRIGEFLAVIDKKTAYLEQKVEKLETYKRGVMQIIFTQKMDANPPEGDFVAWEQKEFLEIAERKTEGYNPIKETSIYKDIELESIASDTGTLLKTFPSNEQRSMKVKFKEDDVLYGKLRPYLRKFYLAKFDGVATSEIWVLRAKAVLPKYLYYLVQTEQFSAVVNIQAGSKMPRADWSTVSREVYLIPPKARQQKIADFLSALDEKIEFTRGTLEKTKEFKKSLLQRMFV